MMKVLGVKGERVARGFGANFLSSFRGGPSTLPQQQPQPQHDDR